MDIWYHIYIIISSMTKGKEEMELKSEESDLFCHIGILWPLISYLLPYDPQFIHLQNGYNLIYQSMTLIHIKRKNMYEGLFVNTRACRQQPSPS